MERVLIFNIKSDFGAFIKPQSNNNPETYAIIPKSTLVGMIGANLGYDRNFMIEHDVYALLTNNLKYSISLNSPFTKESWSEYSYNHLNMKQSGRPMYTPGKTERIYNVDYTVYVKYNTDDNELVTNTINAFIENIKNEMSAFPMYMGMANMPCDIKYIDDIALNSAKQGEFITKGICTNIIPSDKQEYDMLCTDVIPTRSLGFLTMDKTSNVNIYFHEQCGDVMCIGEYYQVNDQCVEFI